MVGKASGAEGDEQEEIRELNVILWPFKLSLRDGSIPHVGSGWGLKKWEKTWKVSMSFLSMTGHWANPIAMA